MGLVLAVFCGRSHVAGHGGHVRGAGWADEGLVPTCATMGQGTQQGTQQGTSMAVEPHDGRQGLGDTCAREEARAGLPAQPGGRKPRPGRVRGPGGTPQ